MTAMRPGAPSALDRAALLRLLAATGAECLPLGLQAVLGYEHVPKATLATDDPAAHDGLAAYTGSLPPPPPRLQAALWGACRVDHPAPSSSPAAAPEPARPPLTAADWQGDPQAPAPWVPPIVPQPRLRQALARALQVWHPAGPDVHALLRRLSRGELPAQLPRRTQPHRPAQWLLVLDVGGGLSLYSRDMADLLRCAARHFGGQGFMARAMANPQQPLAGWVNLPLRRARQPGPASAAEPATPQPWAPLPPGMPVLLVSDLGLAGGATQVPAAWQNWLSLVQRDGARVQLWSPVPLRAQHLAQGGPLPPAVHWSAASPLRPQPLPQGRQHDTPARQAQALALRARLGLAPWIDADLLRLLRHSLRPAVADAGIEHLVWTSEAFTRAPFSRRARAECLEPLHQAFDALPPTDQHQAAQQLQRYYAPFSQPLAHLHTLAWSQRPRAQAERHADMAAPVAAAQDFMARALAQPQNTGLPPAETRVFLHAWLDQADAHHRQALAPLREQAQHALARLQPAHAGPRLLRADMPHELAAGARASQPAWQGQLVHDSLLGQLALLPGPLQPHQLPLLEAPLHLPGADLHHAADASRRWLPLPPGSTQVLASTQGHSAPLHVRSTTCSLSLSLIRRPRGTLAWGRNADGLHWRGAALGPLQPSATHPHIQLMPGSAERLDLHIPAQASADPRVRFGVDGQGLYADVSLKGVEQRFRWIEPGEFWMGSPEHEAGRYDDEGPRHRVKLSQGLWLADTACTQSLWRAVVGRNPSHFTGKDRPVEQVSWDDVQGFLQRLQPQLPAGVEAVLPTEAQWEYACRAGSETAYSFGDELLPGRVNCDASETLAVKSLPANDWGLYGMHGGVWEWCADGMREYTAEPQRDPQGAAGRARVVRGGSWDSDPAFARSAFRYHGRRDSRSGLQGFRLALRSMEGGGAPGFEGLGGARAVEGAGGTRPGQAEPGPPKKSRPLLPDGLKRLFVQPRRKR